MFRGTLARGTEMLSNLLHSNKPIKKAFREVADDRIAGSEKLYDAVVPKEGNFTDVDRIKSLFYHQDGSLSGKRIAGVAGTTAGVGIAGLAAAKGGYDTVFGKD